jgi:DNA helicase-2/ATP-dependent DNA helicase PcrA
LDPALEGPLDPQPLEQQVNESIGSPQETSAAFERDIASLTVAQLQAVEADSRALCIIAGAGSGKTRVLTLRAARRIRDGTAESDHTVICTFTRKAAYELRQRLRHYGVTVSTPATAANAPTPGVRSGTLHQLALTLLRRNAIDSGRPVPTVAEHRYRMLSTISGDSTIASALDVEIGWAKANCLTPLSYGDAAAAVGRPAVLSVDQVVDAFEEYEASLRRKGMLDLDDVLLRSADLIHQHNEFAERVRWRYRHLSVDEFQDVNPAQFRLILALSGNEQDLCVVGDPNQAIYGWNGADPELLNRLDQCVEGLAIVRLDENHRSSPQIVAAASAALGTVAAVPPRSKAADGPMPVVTAYDDDTAEAEGVAALLAQRSAEGMKWSDQAVLARTNDQLSVVRGALGRAGIPCKMAPGPEAGPPKGRSDDDAVELATFHRAKGLEWASVAVVGLEDGYVPIIYAESQSARAEERRLLYVALTRASQDLHCSWVRVRTMGRGQKVERQPSPWLASIARVSRTGSSRLLPVDTGRRIAAMRAHLDN